MTPTAPIPVHLAADELADLAAIAAAARVPLATLARQIVQEYIGPRRVQVDRGRHEAAERLAILRKWWDARKGGAAMGFRESQVTAQFLARLAARKGSREVSRRTLYYWERRYQGGGLAGLVDGRHDRRRAGPDTRLFMETFSRLYRGTRRPLMTVCYREACKVARKQGWPVKSYRSACRHLALRKRPAKGRPKRLR